MKRTLPQALDDGLNREMAGSAQHKKIVTSPATLQNASAQGRNIGAMDDVVKKGIGVEYRDCFIDAEAGSSDSNEVARGAWAKDARQSQQDGSSSVRARRHPRTRGTSGRQTPAPRR